MVSILNQLAVLAVVFSFLADLVIVYERHRTETAEDDKTFLGFCLFTATIRVVAFGWLANAWSGFAMVVALILLVLSLRTCIVDARDYIRARKAHKSQPTVEEIEPTKV